MSATSRNLDSQVQPAKDGPGGSRTPLHPYDHLTKPICERLLGSCFIFRAVCIMCTASDPHLAGSRGWVAVRMRAEPTHYSYRSYLYLIVVSMYISQYVRYESSKWATAFALHLTANLTSRSVIPGVARLERYHQLSAYIHSRPPRVCCVLLRYGTLCGVFRGCEA